MECNDELIARMLHMDEMEETSLFECDHLAMMGTIEGSAVLLAKEVIQVKENLANPDTASYVDVVGSDTMVALAEKFLAKRIEFVKQNKSLEIDVGFHYTGKDRMQSIQEHGLMNRADRLAAGIVTVFNGAYFGDGVYTAHNHLSSRDFGDVGILVGRLKGRVVNAFPRPYQSTSHDSVKAGSNSLVLCQSSQCIPLLQFDKAILKVPRGPETVLALKTRLEELLDKFFDSTNLGGRSQDEDASE